MSDSSAVGVKRIGRAVYELLRKQITDGSIAPGMCLPSTRVLAEDLAISRSTVSAAYEQLAAEGYVETSPGSRTRVVFGMTTTMRRDAEAFGHMDCAQRLSAYGQRVSDACRVAPATTFAGSEELIDFLYGALAFDDFPTLGWRRAYNRLLVQRQSLLAYEDPAGACALREALQGYLLRARGLCCDVDQILIVHGSQQAIDLCSRVLVDTADAVLMEEPGYAMARRVFETAGATVVPCPVDERGLITERLSDRKGKLVYVTPSHQFPLGGVMPVGRRQELLAWAKETRAWVIEDDYDGEFRYGLRPVDTLQSIDESGSVIYVGTFSKSLSPQIRLGYLVLPRALVAVFREAKRLMDRHAPRLDQLVLAALISDGSYERHIRRCKRLHESRRGALLHALEQYLGPAVQIEGSASGLHLVIWLLQIDQRDEMLLVERARELGVGVRPVSPLYAAGTQYRIQRCAGLILGYASLTIERIESGVRLLTDAVVEITNDHAVKSDNR